MEALQGNDDAMSWIRDVGTRVLDRYFDAPASDTHEALSRASIYVADRVSAGLTDVGTGLQAECERILPDGSQGRVGQFAIATRAPDLLRAAYSGLSLWLCGSVPARVCEGCGRVFAVKDPRQRFHDPRCAQRARYRRFADRKEAT